MNTAVQEARAHVEAKRADIARVRKELAQASRLQWTVVVFGTIYPLVGVALFAMEKGVPGWIAWMLEPTFVGLLCVTVIADQSLTRNGATGGFWLRAGRWVACGSSIVLNTFQPLAAHAPGPAGERGAWAPDWGSVLVHGLSPLAVFFAVEGAAIYRKKSAEIIDRLLSDVAAAEAGVRAARAAAVAAEYARRDAEAQRQAQQREKRDEEARRQRFLEDEEARRAREDEERREQLEYDRRQAELRAEREHELAIARAKAEARRATDPAAPQPATPRPPAPRPSPAPVSVESDPPRRILPDRTPAQIAAEIDREIARQIIAAGVKEWTPDYEQLARTYVVRDDQGQLQPKGRRWLEYRVDAARSIAARHAENTNEREEPAA